jgi:hypothetical protein
MMVSFRALRALGARWTLRTVRPLELLRAVGLFHAIRPFELRLVELGPAGVLPMIVPICAPMVVLMVGVLMIVLLVGVLMIVLLVGVLMIVLLVGVLMVVLLVSVLMVGLLVSAHNVAELEA